MKWDLPPEPPPWWLDPSFEVHAADEPLHLAKGGFILACLDALRDEGLTPDQAFEVAANSMNETGWGAHYVAYNLGGWKVWPFSAKNSDSTPRRWSRAPGNKAPGATPTDLRGGDPPWVYYRAFGSLRGYFKQWLSTFVPRVDPGAKPNGRYWNSGQQFWAGADWFDDLIAAGYKGDNTRLHPEASLEAHHAIIATLRVYWCQRALGVVADGAWQPKSKAACADYQQIHGLAPTRRLDAVTQAMLFSPWGSVPT